MPNYPRLILPAKKIRAEIISKFIADAGYRGCVAFSCGHATTELRLAGVWVLDISPTGDLQPTNKWWKPAEIHKAFPDLFDATSGHLPAPIMVLISQAFKEYLGELPYPEYEVPTGSGETIICLRWAYPDIKFHPVFNVWKGTEYDERNALNYAIGAE